MLDTELSPLVRWGSDRVNEGEFLQNPRYSTFVDRLMKNLSKIPIEY